jgi:hypothetical protein
LRLALTNRKSTGTLPAPPGISIRADSLSRYDWISSSTSATRFVRELLSFIWNLLQGKPGDPENLPIPTSLISQYRQKLKES